MTSIFSLMSSPLNPVSEWGLKHFLNNDYNFEYLIPVIH